MADITYANKDKTATLGAAERTWRDVDANEVKDVINNHRASKVDGLVPLSELPDAAKTILNAEDFDADGIANGFIVFWDTGSSTFRTKAEANVGTNLTISGNTDVFLFDREVDGDEVTLLIGLDDQDAGHVLIAPATETGTPTFRRLVVSDIPGLEGFITAQAIASVATVADLSTFIRGDIETLFVRDTDRGGNFSYVEEGLFVGTFDSVNSFLAQDGGYWVRVQEFFTNSLKAGMVGDGVTNNKTIIDYVNSLGIEFSFSNGTYVINGDTTINFPVRIEATAKIKIIGDTKLIFNGPFSAGNYQVFDFSESNYYNPNVANLGNIEFGRGSQTETKVIWFGADNETESTEAIQRAIWATVQGTVQMSNANYYISATLLFRNSIAFRGTGLRTATQLTLTEDFYDVLNTDVVLADGNRVVITGFAQPTLSGEVPYQDIYGDWRKLNHSIFSDFAIWGITDSPTEKGRPDTVAFCGSFYEATFFNVSVYYCWMAYWCHMSNTRILGSYQVEYARTGFKLGGGGGLVQGGTVIYNDIGFDIGWTSNTNAEFSLDITLDTVHIEAHFLKFRIRNGVRNTNLIGMHMFGFAGSVFSVHPASQVFMQGISSSPGFSGMLPMSPVTNKTYAMPDYNYGGGHAIQLVPDGDLQKVGYDVTNWTIDEVSGTLRKLSYEGGEYPSQSYENKYMLRCATAVTTCTVESGTFTELGILDVEVDLLITHEFKVEVLDSLDAVIYNSDWKFGTMTTRDVHVPPLKICGFIEAAGTGPYRLKMSSRNNADPLSARYDIRKACMYQGYTLSDGVTAGGGTTAYTISDPLETFDGFKVYTLTGAGSVGGWSKELLKIDGARIKLMGWARLQTEGVNVIRTSMTDVAILGNIIQRNDLFDLDWSWIEQTHDALTAIRLFCANDDYVIELAGLGVMVLYPSLEDNRIILDAIPTDGWWARGQRVDFREPSAAGFLGAVCVASGSPGTWKNYGAIEA